MSEIRACEWREDDDGNWETECGELAVIPEGTPRDNGMNFCWHCGLPLVQVEYEGGDDE